MTDNLKEKSADWLKQKLKDTQKKYTDLMAQRDEYAEWDPLDPEIDRLWELSKDLSLELARRNPRFLEIEDNLKRREGWDG